jgi:signal transduction histidine kinase
MLTRYRSSKQYPYSSFGSALLLGCALWITAEAFEILSHRNPGKLIWDQIGYVGVYTIAPAWLFFTIKFSGQDKLLAGRKWLFFCIVPAISLLLLFTNPLHELIWTMKSDSGYLEPFSKTRRFAYYCLNGAMTFQFLLGAFWLLRMLSRTRSFYRRQIAVLSFLMMIPLSISMYELITKEKLFYPLSANPFLCCLSATLLAWLLIKMRWGDIISASRGFILGKMSDAVLVIDSVNILVDANETALEIMDKELREVRRQPLDSAWPLLHSAIQKHGVGSIPAEDIPLELGRKKKVFNMAITPLSDWMNRIVSKIVVLRDVTESRELEEKLKYHADELMASNEELQHFAYAATHDLQEPARMVASYLALLGKRNEGKLDKESLEFMAFATDGANRMARLLNDLLEYSKFGTNTLPIAEADCNQIVADVLRNLKLQIEESNASIEKGSLPKIKGSREQLSQLFQNLISNGIKFRRKDAPLMRISAKQQGTQWLFKVEDNGIGIKHEHKERIFQIFQRLHPHDEYEGTGMGLAICKKVVNRHGGEIWMESEPGTGTTFFFTLNG